MSEESVQLNARIPRAVAWGAKRLAKSRGITVNVLVADVLSRELRVEADVLLSEIAEEERRASIEYAAVREWLTETVETEGN